MSGFFSQKKQSQVPERKSASLDAPTNDTQASSWGNGVMAESVKNSNLPSSGPSIADSFSGISQDLASTGYGGGGKSYGDWTGFGAGGAYGGEVGGDGPYSWKGGFGAGAGGGYGSFDQSTFNESNGWERTASGQGGGLGVGGRVDSTTSYGSAGKASASGDIYRGVGGNAYGFNETNKHTGQSRSGYGVDANYTPLGLNDAKVSAAGPGYKVQASAGNVTLGQQGGHGEVYKTSDGQYGAQGGFTAGRNSAKDLKGSIDTPLGSTKASVGSISQGKYYKGGIEAGKNGVTATYEQGGALAIKDANLEHSGPLGTTKASGSTSGISPTQGKAGYDARTGKVFLGGNDKNGHASHGAGRKYEDVNVSHTAGPAHVSAGAKGIEHGWRADGSGYVDLKNGTAHAEGNYQGGGVSVDGANVNYGIDGIADVKGSADHISTATSVKDATVDYKDGALSAGVGEVRTGGFRAQGLKAEQNVLGINSKASVSEISNDVLVKNAQAKIDSSGLAASVDEVDFGGVRVKDAAYETDLGGYGEVKAKGSFANGNNIKNASLDINGDGINAKVGEFGVMGTDANADISAKGPGGSYLDAKGTYHSGLAGKNVTASINGDGISVGAENLNYNQHQVKDVAVKSGIEGVYEQSASLKEGHLHQANVNDLQANIDGSGAKFSVGEANYSYAGVEGLEATQKFAGGAVGTKVGVGKANYLGAGVGSAKFQSDFLTGKSSAEINNLNAHGLTAEDVEVGANIGDAKARIGADSLSVIDANIGQIKGESSNYGLTQKGSATDVDIGLLRAKNLGGGLSYGDQNIVSAKANLDASVGADKVEGAFDLTKGTASGAIENGRVTAMADGQIGIGDYNIDVGRTGVDANVNANGEVDVMNGTANGSASLAGSKVSLFGMEGEVGEWAQASGGVNAREGAANFNVGGENGVGADMNLSEGNLDINVGGYEIDVDEGVRAAGRGIAAGASAVADGASYVGGKVADGASAAWDAVTSW